MGKSSWRSPPKHEARTMSEQLTALLERNRIWACDVEAAEPGFFESLCGQQAPDYLWIGCADSGVPANELVDLRPG